MSDHEEILQESKNENRTRTLTVGSFNGPLALFILTAIAIVATTIYLTSHYFDAHYPTTLAGAATFCNISSYFNCDAATFSPLAQVALIPTSFLGLLIGVVFLLGCLFPSEGSEQTLKFIALINAIGCFLLFLYSIFILKGLCPMCSLYYVLSFCCLFLLWKYSELPFTPDPKSLAMAVMIIVISAGIMNVSVSEKYIKQQKIAEKLVDDFMKKEKVGDPEESPYIIHKSGAHFSDSKIRISIFSDFQCPFCQRVAEQMETLARLYKDTMSIQYFFFPLDSNCNSSVTRAIHPQACYASYLAACSVDHFLDIHDEIFNHQDKIDRNFIQGLAKKYDMTNCLEDEDVKSEVIRSVAVGNEFKVNSTPTVIINGVKISGTLQNYQYRAIFDALLLR